MMNCWDNWKNICYNDVQKTVIVGGKQWQIRTGMHYFSV